MEKIDVFGELEKALPPIVFRNWKDWRHVLPVAPQTVVNADSLGIGPVQKIMVGGVVGYPRVALIAWLKERSRVVFGEEVGSHE